MGFKYIMIDVTVPDKDNPDPIVHRLPVIFPDMLVHRDVFDSLIHSMSLRDFDCKIHSAGECQITCDEASGNSETLKVKSDPNDEANINNFPYWHGIQ